MKHLITTIALAPILVAQGRAVRRRIPKLPEPPGPRAGLAGQGHPLRLLIAGDSAAAGVGASSQAEALSGQLIDCLSPHYHLDWRLEARTGYTTRQTLAHLRRLPEARFDILVTSLGVNDVTRGLSASAWLASQRELRDFARQSLGVRLVIATGLPPVHLFPALPQPLRWYLGNRATSFNDLLRNDLATDPSSRFLDLRRSLDPPNLTHIASDGFHPGPATYATWARLVADLVRHSWPQ